MLCPICKKANISEEASSYNCPSCNFRINKVILTKQISLPMVGDICKYGETKLIKGFVSKKGKLFDAKLVVEGNKLTFAFPNSKKAELKKDFKQDLINIRVQSTTSGVANINITGKINYSVFVDFGLVPSRMAECLALISAVKYLKHNGIVNDKISISANNREFVEYVLKETTPRKKDMRDTINHLWRTLEPYSWEIRHEKQQRKTLKGGTTNKAFPQGLYPWIDLEKKIANNCIYINTKCPAVSSQLLASIKASSKIDGQIRIPITVKSVFDAWEITVKKG